MLLVLHSDDLLAYDDAIADIAKHLKVQGVMLFMAIWSMLPKMIRLNVLDYGKVVHLVVSR